MSQDQSYIYLNEDDLKKPVFRIFKQHHFCDLLLTCKNTLVHPSKWDDPFENYLLNQKIDTEDGPASNHSRKNIYGQCWTFEVESDAMWRIYSANCKGIKVKTTIDKLFKSFKDKCSSIQNQYCYIGRVKYYERQHFSQLRKEFEETQRWSVDGSLEAHTLLYKREIFSYEKEIRLISFHRELSPKSKLFKYPCSPIGLFDEIVLDPRLQADEVSALIDKLGDIGLDSEIIKQSELYSLDPEEIKILKHPKQE